MSRTQNVKRNLIFNVIKFVTQLVLQFVLRTILIYVMGKSYVGLNGLFSNIFQFLNLAELGVGSAIVFAMYKPIAENDIEKIKALQNLYKKFYLIIAVVVLIIGGILTPFLNVFIKDISEVPSSVNIYILFVMYLFNAVVGYLSAHKRSLLLAYERNDIENKIKTICLFAMGAIQILVLFLFKNYYVYFAVNIVFTIIECIVTHIIANKYYPEINGASQPIDKETKKAITKNVAALSMHKIGGAVVFSTDNILVSSFFGVVILGAYSNYALIISSFGTLYNLLSNALSGSVGNLIASRDTEYVYKKYRQLNFIYSFLTAFIAICMFVLFQPFISAWTSKAQDGSSLLMFSTVLIICLSFYLDKMRRCTLVFKDCAGLFWQDRWKPIVESVVNLGASIGLAYLMGINGVFLGTIISTVVAPLWVEPYILYKHYFKKSVWLYIRHYLLDAGIMVVVCAISYFTCLLIPDGGIWLLIAKFAVCIVLTLVFLILCYCWMPEFKETMKLVKSIILGLFKNKKNTKTEIVTNQSNSVGEDLEKSQDSLVLQDTPNQEEILDEEISNNSLNNDISIHSTKNPNKKSRKKLKKEEREEVKKEKTKEPKNEEMKIKK